MVETFKIAAYTRISVDLELNRENTSIENQKAIIGDYCKMNFPTSTVDYFEDRDHSGYTFEQRPGYMELRPKLLSKQYDILIVKDLSRFSRRTGKGLAEFEMLVEDSGLRIIAIGDGVDYPTRDDWMKIKLYFFVNEMPVTDTSNKVSNVIANRQNKGEWICSVPYGYVMTNTKKMQFEVDESAAEVVRRIFALYIDGWGYKKIANYLTDHHIPTPRMCEKARKEAAGDEYRKKVKEAWSIVTISEIICNDFYIGTLRQRKFHRKKINGKDVELDENEHIVFEDHHPAIVDYRIFATAREQLKKRTTSCYRGLKKYDNTYSGFLFCGDCGSPMFPLSRKDLAEAYTCGTYHVRGTKGCSSHHIRADVLDRTIKMYVEKLKLVSANILASLESSIKNESVVIQNSTATVTNLQAMLADAQEELKALQRQKVRDVMRAGENAEVIEQTFDALITECINRIKGLKNEMQMVTDTKNTIVRVNRITKTILEILDEITAKPKLNRTDLNLLLDRIIVYEDHIDIKLKPDVDELLRTGTIETEKIANFDHDTENIERATEILDSVAVQSAEKHADKVFCVHVISNGDPLEIYTDREGEVIFKKYSPIGELASFASQYAETLHRVCSLAVVICDRDAVIACSGVSRKDYSEKPLSKEMEKIVESRTFFEQRDGVEPVPVLSGGNSLFVSCAMPIISGGDIVGCVAGDDTIFAATHNEYDAKTVTEKIKQSLRTL